MKIVTGKIYSAQVFGKYRPIKIIRAGRDADYWMVEVMELKNNNHREVYMHERYIKKGIRPERGRSEGEKKEISKAVPSNRCSLR